MKIEDILEDERKRLQEEHIYRLKKSEEADEGDDPNAMLHNST